MDRTLKIYIGILLLLLATIVIIDLNKPKKVDWTPTYGLRDKLPLGLYVLDHELPELLKPYEVKKITVTPYEYLEPLFDYDTLVDDYRVHGTIMAIAERNTLDKESLSELFYFVSRGNSVFMSMKQFPKLL